MAQNDQNSSLEAWKLTWNVPPHWTACVAQGFFLLVFPSKVIMVWVARVVRVVWVVLRGKAKSHPKKSVAVKPDQRGW